MGANISEDRPPRSLCLKLLYLGEFFIGKLHVMNKTQIHQAILARDIIDMARDNDTNLDILEYAESICWELFMIFDNHENVIKWNNLSGAFEQHYLALRNGESAGKLLDVEDVYQVAVRIIESHSLNASS